MLFLPRFASLFLGTLLLVLGGCGLTPAFALPEVPEALSTVVPRHDKGDFLPSLPTWAQRRVMERGYGLYKMDDRTRNWPGVRNTIYRCMDDEWAATHINWYDVTNDPAADADLIFYMPDNYPNDGSVGVAYYGNAPAFVNVNFRAPIVVWDSTYCHELGHIHGIEDFYKHPLTCDPTVTWSVMSCGTGVGRLQSLDRDLHLNVYIPDLPSETFVINDGTHLWVAYNSIRQSALGCTPFAAVSRNYAATEKDNYCGHPSRYLDNVTRVAIYYQDAGFGVAFTGFYGSPAARDRYASRGFRLNDWCLPGRVFLVHPESSLPATWPTFAGGIGFLSGDLKYAGGC